MKHSHKKPSIKHRVKHKIHEIKEDFKLKFTIFLIFAFVGFLTWMLFYMIYVFYGFSIVEWFKGLPYAYTIFSHVIEQIKLKSDWGIFYTFVFSSLFFLPIPLEALYFSFLREGIAFQEIFFITVAGILCGQIINYWLGRMFGFILIHFIKRKNRDKVRERLSKYGPVALISVHIIPFPFQIFNMISGVLKYKFIKWLLFVTIGTVIKHIAMILIFIRFF